MHVKGKEQDGQLTNNKSSENCNVVRSFKEGIVGSKREEVGED